MKSKQKALLTIYIIYTVQAYITIVIIILLLKCAHQSIFVNRIN